MKAARLLILSVLCTLLVTGLSCSGSVSTPTSTPTPTATATQQTTVTPTATTPTVSAVTASIESPEALKKSSGRYFHAYVNITSVNNFYMATYDITYDPTVIRVQDVTVGDISGTNIRIEKWSYIPAKTQGTLRIVNNVPTSASASGVSGEGCLADIYFKVMGNPGDSSIISFIEGLGEPLGHLTICNNQIIEIAATWVNASVTIE
jgi:hypothetical protein